VTHKLSQLIIVIVRLQSLLPSLIVGLDLFENLLDVGIRGEFVLEIMVRYA
jgi:hypothetical protein